MIKEFFPIVALAILLALITSASASKEGVAPGKAASGNMILGENAASLSIDVAPVGGFLSLQESSTGSVGDRITVTSDSAWKLRVEDKNAASSSSDGKMRRGTMISTWNYDNPDHPLIENFNVYVRGIGENGNLPETIALNDVTDLSYPRYIIESSAASSQISVKLQYSQNVKTGELSGAYRIDLVYKLSSNP